MEQISKFSSCIKTALERQIDDRDPSNISMSSLGHCGRQLAYRMHGITGKPLDWRARMIFNDGDWTHEQLRRMLTQSLVEAKSCFRLTKEEFECEFEGIFGHVDGVLAHSADCKETGPEHVDHLLEVKSMNDRAFAELAKTHTLPWEYRCQVSGYLAGMGLQHAIILAKNKNNGQLLEYRYAIERDILIDRMKVIDSVAGSDGPEDVKRDFKPNNRGNLPWQCNYCPYVQLCWREFDLVERKGRKYGIDYKLYQAWQALNSEAPND